jgi:O-antigen/teichoic acid export membrane protein
MARSLIKSTLLYLPAQLLGPLVQFIVVVTWTHLLEPAAFGIVTFVVAAQELTALFGLVWWSIYILRFRQRFVGDDRARFRAMDSRMVAVGAASQALFAPLCLLAIGVSLDAATVAASAGYLIARLIVVH